MRADQAGAALAVPAFLQVLVSPVTRTLASAKYRGSPVGAVSATFDVRSHLRESANLRLIGPTHSGGSRCRARREPLRHRSGRAWMPRCDLSKPGIVGDAGDTVLGSYRYRRDPMIAIGHDLDLQGEIALIAALDLVGQRRELAIDHDDASLPTATVILPPCPISM